MFEEAKWITRNPLTSWTMNNDPLTEPPSPYMTRDFTVVSEVKCAVLNICGLGQAAYYINGKRIQDSYLPTPPFDSTKTVIYNSYNVTQMLCGGNNRIGAILGNNGYNDIGVSAMRSSLKLVCSLEIEYSNGRKEKIVSDTKWKTADSHVVFSLRRSGEKHDADKEIKNWCRPEFDNSNWDQAHICLPPGGKYRKSICPPVRVRSFVKPIALSENLFDFKTVSAGWVKIKVTGNAGEEIAVKYAERLSESGKNVDQKSVYNGICPSMCHIDRFVLNGETNEFEQLFGYHSFRYVEVDGAFDSIEITAVFANTYASAVSDFHCDDEIINSIHSMCVNSIQSNLHGALTDCPGREQNEWTGDGLLSAEAVAVNFNAYNILTHWLLQFKDAQLQSGGLPCIIPPKNPVWEYNFANGPDWDSAIFHIPYYLYKYTGNNKIVRLMWNNMNYSLKYFSKLSDTGIPDFGVGDWCAMGEMCDKRITNAVYYRVAALMMAELAEASGKRKNSYRKLAERIKIEFRNKYIREGKINTQNETALAAALFGKMLNGEEIAETAKLLDSVIRKNGYRFSCGVHGLRMIFDALSENGYSETVYKTVTNTEFPGYGYCVKKGLTALPERFDFETPKEGMDSLNHHFRSQVDVWFYKYLAGIRFEGFGGEKIVISPQYVSGIKKLSASIKGINISYDESELSVESPFDFTYVGKDGERLYNAGKYIFSLKT